MRSRQFVRRAAPTSKKSQTELEWTIALAVISSALDAVTDAEALIIATEWNEFANVDLAVVKEKMRTPIVFDGRNLLDPETMRRLGFHYHSIGRANAKPQ